MISVKTLSAFILLTLSAVSIPAFSNDQSDTSGEIFLVAHIDVKDHEAYIEEYGRPVVKQLTAIGAEILVASPDPQVLEGEWHGNWTVILKFPNAEAAHNWYNSTEYDALKKLRIKKLTNGGNVAFFQKLKLDQEQNGAVTSENDF